MDLAARTAEVVFGLASNIDRGRAFYQNVKSRMAAYGRHQDDLKIMPGVVPPLVRLESGAKGR
jgi:alkanesulfonate monooxygenase SsuD/methylene tetrahydromethanopterin reductase-like flavin-dependent oxidoreductase (luciferase family)